MDKRLHGASKFTNKVYNEYGSEKKYNNALRKEGAIMALLAVAASLKMHSFLESKINSLRTKADCLSKK